MGKQWIVVLALVPALATAAEDSGTVEGAQADVVSRMTAITVFKAVEDCHTQSLIARRVVTAKERNVDRARVIGIAGDDQKLVSMVNSVYDAETVDENLDVEVFQECLNESKQRLIE